MDIYDLWMEVNNIRLKASKVIENETSVVQPDEVRVADATEIVVTCNKMIEFINQHRLND